MAAELADGPVAGRLIWSRQEALIWSEVASRPSGKRGAVTRVDPRLRVLLILVGAAAFGAGMSFLKGNDAGIRDEIGNLSTPWLLLPFLAGALTNGRRLRGAAVGLAATLVALTAFYVANAFVLDLGRHSRAEDLRLAFGNGYWFARGLVSGPVFGWLGGAWRRRGFPYWGVAVVLLLDLEPLALALNQRMAHLGSFAFAPSAAVAVGEAAAGLGAAALLVVAIARSKARPARPS
jgi:hypothetical protein